MTNELRIKIRSEQTRRLSEVELLAARLVDLMEKYDAAVFEEVKCWGCGRKYRVAVLVRTYVDENGNPGAHVIVIDTHREEVKVLDVEIPDDYTAADVAYDVLLYLYPY